MSGEQVTSRDRLRVEWVGVALLAFALLVAGRGVVADMADIPTADSWALVAGSVLLYTVAFLWNHLGHNHPTDGTLGASLGLANLLTMTRGMAYAAAAGFMFVPPSTPLLTWAPAVLYGTGVALDGLDGWVARNVGRTTRLGAKLDHAFDTLGFLLVPFVGVARGRLPVVYLSLSVARYLFIAACRYRRYRGRPVGSLPPSRLRRPLAAVQMVVITVALVPLLPADLVRPAAAAAVVPSLALFARDYLAVAEHI